MDNGHQMRTGVDASAPNTCALFLAPKLLKPCQLPGPLDRVAVRRHRGGPVHQRTAAMCHTGRARALRGAVRGTVDVEPTQRRRPTGIGAVLRALIGGQPLYWGSWNRPIGSLPRLCGCAFRSRAPISTIGRQSIPVFDACYSAAFGKTPGSSRPAKRCRACAIFSPPLTAVAIMSTMVKDEWMRPCPCNCSTGTPAEARASA